MATDLSLESAHNSPEVQAFHHQLSEKLNGHQYLVYCENNCNRFGVSRLNDGGILINFFDYRDYIIYEDGTCTGGNYAENNFLVIPEDEILSIRTALDNCTEVMDDETIAKEQLSKDDLKTLVDEARQAILVHFIGK